MTDPIALDIEGIIDRLPHRFPFLLVDRVLSLTAGESITAIKNVSINESYFEGHFPQFRVMPGVLVVEALAQAAGVLSWETAKDEPEKVEILYLAGLENVRFKHPVTPGDQIVLKAELVRRRRALWRYVGVAEVDGKVAAEAEILLVTRKEP